jgi:hypothetical protein
VLPLPADGPSACSNARNRCWSKASNREGNPEQGDDGLLWRHRKVSNNAGVQPSSGPFSTDVTQKGSEPTWSVKEFPCNF